MYEQYKPSNNSSEQTLIPNVSINEQPINFINNINLSNLSQEEQNKILSISNLQAMIKQSHQTAQASNLKNTMGESNIKKERELSEREKIELEMKKWEKEQKKVLMFYIIFLD